MVEINKQILCFLSFQDTDTEETIVEQVERTNQFWFQPFEFLLSQSLNALVVRLCIIPQLSWISLTVNKQSGLDVRMSFNDCFAGLGKLVGINGRIQFE